MASRRVDTVLNKVRFKAVDVVTWGEELNNSSIYKRVQFQVKSSGKPQS